MFPFTHPQKRAGGRGAGRGEERDYLPEWKEKEEGKEANRTGRNQKDGNTQGGIFKRTPWEFS